MWGVRPPPPPPPPQLASLSNNMCKKCIQLRKVRTGVGFCYLGVASADISISQRKEDDKCLPFSEQIILLFVQKKRQNVVFTECDQRHRKETQQKEPALPPPKKMENLTHLVIPYEDESIHFLPSICSAALSFGLPLCKI
jgi:hypothetical protein